MLFGNSRGRYPVSRECFEDPIYKLTYCLDPDNTGYPQEFENDIFIIRPYWWGGCTCGAEEKQRIFYTLHKHDKKCFTLLTKRTIKEPIYHYIGPLEEEAKLEKKVLKDFLIKHGKNPNTSTWDIDTLCDCGFKEKEEELLSKTQCAETCKLELPNFHYKPTDFKLCWYKYPLRDSYMNQNLSIQDFDQIIKQCINSLG